MEYQFIERMPKCIKPEDIMHHISSKGCPVDIYLQNEFITFGITTIPPGNRLGRMAAHGGDEIYYILEGDCIVECPRHRTEFKLSKGDIFHIPAGQIHAPRNDSDKDVRILWACTPLWP